MRRLLAIVGALLALCTVPLGLVGPTSLLLLPAHAALTLIATVGAVLEGARGAPERARAWGFGHLIATFGVMLAFELGRRATVGGWWVIPWLGIVSWGWVPMVVAGGSGWIGEWVLRWRNRRTLRGRHKELR